MLKVFICVILACLTITAPARADDINWSVWRVIAGDGSYATSNCIGSIETPGCIADTWAACYAQPHGPLDNRSEYKPYYRFKDICRDLFKKVGHMPYVWFFKSELPLPPIQFYRTRTWTVETMDIPEKLNETVSTEGSPAYGLPKMLPGDTIVEMQSASCRATNECLARRKAGKVDTCPPVACYGLEGDLVEYGYCNQGDGKSTFEAPSQYIVLRKAEHGWLLPHYGSPSARGYNCNTNFFPDHWVKRK